MRSLGFFTFLVVMALSCTCFAAGFPYMLNYQGMLTSKTGQPVNEPQDITFSLYTTPLGAELHFWTDTLVKVSVSNGQFSVTLGTGTPLDPSKFSGETYLGIQVGSQAEMLPRQKMTSVPYALKALDSQNAVTAQTAAFATTATGVVPKGGIIMWSGTTAPLGWALCDGSNGTPNLKERFIVGASDLYISGTIGGEAMHTLTTDQMPSHSHELKIRTSNSATSANVNADPARASVGGGWSGATHFTENAGGGAPFSNLPPYYALAFIMKL